MKYQGEDLGGIGLLGSLLSSNGPPVFTQVILSTEQGALP